MGLLDWFRKKDPTAEWPVVPPRPLRFDLLRAEMDGVAIGASMDALRSTFGRPHNPRPLGDLHFSYPPIGMEVPLDADQRVLLFSCVFRPQLGEDEIARDLDFQPADLTLRLADGREVRIGEETSRAEVEEVLGPLVLAEGVPGDDDIHEVTHGDVWLGFTLDAEGRVARLDLEPAGER